jgi:hypothetical protein
MISVSYRAPVWSKFLESRRITRLAEYNRRWRVPGIPAVIIIDW